MQRGEGRWNASMDRSTGPERAVRNVSTTLRQRLLDFKLDFLRLALVD